MRSRSIAVLLFLLLLTCACTQSGSPTISLQTPGSSPSTPSPTPDKITDHDGIFTVSQKKYDYNGKGLVIVNVENKSSDAYDVTLAASYLDSDKNVIKSETKAYKGFIANWSNNFIFYPEISFESFEVELKITPASEPAFTQYLTVKNNTQVQVSKCLSDGKGLFAYEPKPEYDWYHCVWLDFMGVRSSFDGTLKLKWEAIVIGADGKILKYYKSGSITNYPKTTDPNGNSFNALIYVTDIKVSSSSKYAPPDNVLNASGVLSILYVEEDK